MSSTLELHFLTLFPESFSGILLSSLLGKAQKKGLVSYHMTQIRDFATDKHKTVDDTPYGGGEGMLMRVDVLHAAWKSIVPERSSEVLTVLLSPQGQLFDQIMAKELAGISGQQGRPYRKIIFVCGHYEGVDERFVDLCVDREVSIGNYVLTGGEIAACVMADAITRLVPGVVGNEDSVNKDSLEGGVLKYPQYTRPVEFMGSKVPEILLSGDHPKIARWRREQSEKRTVAKRPDLKKL